MWKEYILSIRHGLNITGRSYICLCIPNIKRRLITKRSCNYNIYYYGSGYKLKYNILNRVVIKKGYIRVTMCS